MSGFIAVAGLLTLAVLVALLYPLLRRREGLPEAWRTGGIAALLLAVGASALYPVLSNFNWSASEPTLDTPQAMVGRLARRLEKQPNDLQGWLQLGRSYAVLEEFPLAIRAYERANSIAKDQSPEAAMGLAEALFGAGRSDLAGRAGRLFEQALQLDPNSTKALFYSALAAAERNEIPLAKQRFARMLDANPPDNVRSMIEEQVRALDATAKMAAAAPAGSSSAVAGTPAVTVPLRVTVGAKVAGKPVPAGARLFVMARIPGQGGPPLAVQLLEPHFPQDVELRSTDAVMGGTGFKAGQELEIEARIANGGGAISQSGDAFGTMRLKAGAGTRASIEINQLKP